MGQTRKRRWLPAALAAGLAALLAVAGGLLGTGVLWFTNPWPDDYPVRGVDVSAYQGEIDWRTLAGQDIAFAYIKATEGSGHVDRYFAANFEAARQTGLRVGAYHFFSFDSAGATQADNFIAAVPKADGMLPPVVDFEFYGDKEKNPPDAAAARRELNVMLNALEGHYGVRPVIYATGKSYEMYLAGQYGNYDIWIRDILAHPELPDGRDWTFWQYSNRGRLAGYSGEERYIDLNVFGGTAEAFALYGA